MATTNYSWNLPTVGGSEDTWGTQLNANWTALDTLLGGVSQAEFAKLDGLTATTAELNFVDGVTANIQTQLDAKAAAATTVSAGGGLTGGGDLSANRTISHADTSSQASVSNTDSTFIQSIALDEYGHVTQITSSEITSSPTVDPTTSQVLSATAGASFGAVGTYAHLGYSGTVTNTDYAPGTVLSASVLTPAGVTRLEQNGVGYVDRYTGGSLSGSWRVMGFVDNVSAGDDSRKGTTIFLRIA